MSKYNPNRFTFSCLECGKEGHSHSKRAKFCCSLCSNLYRSRNVHKRRIAECKEHVKLCKTKGEVKRRFPNDYALCIKYRIPEYKELNNEQSPSRGYTYEEVLAAAKKYTTKADFHKKDLILYFCALRRGWMKNFTWLRSEQHLFQKINVVYRYYFKEQNAVYVGRTIKPEERDFDHKRDRGKESSIVFKFAQENEVEIPKMEILERDLSGEDSQIMEDKYVQQYRNEGMVVLNKGATGIGTGSLGKKKFYTEKKFLEVAHQYEWISDFRRENPSLYCSASKNGWLTKYDFLKRRTRKASLFTKEYCFGVARLCKSRKELFDKDSTVYGKMLQKGWLDECPWLKSAHEGYVKLTHDYCIEVAKKYRSSVPLHKERSPVLRKLYKTGWIKECTWFPGAKNRKVNQYNSDGTFVRQYSSLIEAAKEVAPTGINGQALIGQVC